MAKSRDAFRTISEVAEWLDTPTHVLRFWESKFSQVKPVKRAGGRRYYRLEDMALLGGIKKLLHGDGMTIKGVQKVLREQGINHVSAMSGPVDGIVVVEPPAPAVAPPPVAAEEPKPVPPAKKRARAKPKPTAPEAQGDLFAFAIRREVPKDLREDPADKDVPWQPGLLTAIAKGRIEPTDVDKAKELLSKLEGAHSSTR